LRRRGHLERPSRSTAGTTDFGITDSLIFRGIVGTNLRTGRFGEEAAGGFAYGLAFRRPPNLPASCMTVSHNLKTPTAPLPAGGDAGLLRGRGENFLSAKRIVSPSSLGRRPGTTGVRRKRVLHRGPGGVLPRRGTTKVGACARDGPFARAASESGAETILGRQASSVRSAALMSKGSTAPLAGRAR